MQITASRAKVEFEPITLTLVLENLTELETVKKLTMLDNTIPALLCNPWSDTARELLDNLDTQLKDI